MSTSGGAKTRPVTNSKSAVKLPTAADYVHLHNHSHYSLLDGLQKIPEMVDRVKELGMSSVAITDHGTLSGSIELYKTATEAGIRPIIGIETYVAARKHTDKEPQKDKPNFHLVLLAMNNQGYKNLMQLSTIANLDGYYYKARIDHDLLEQYNEGIIALSGCMGGELSNAFRNGDDVKAKEVAQWYKSVFGDRYYIELQDHSHEWQLQKEVNEKLIALADELEIPLVVTSDAHYLQHSDQEAHEVLLCVQTGSFLSDEGRMSLEEFNLYVTDPKDVIERWEHRPDAIFNAGKIAERCNVTIELGGILIPEFEVPKGETETSYLRQLTYKGLAVRYSEMPEEEAAKISIKQAEKLLPKEFVERTEYELGVVERMGFSGYFLIVADFINWGKDQGIVFGPGRGSAAGSIVSYAMKITDLDPMKYDLLFERFLNPDRISMPDIDIDIQDTRRDEVIQYTVEKYGQEQVANIVTFGTMAARNAIRDVARVLQVPYAEADRLAKLVPAPIQGRHIPLSVSIKEDAELKKEYSGNNESKRVIDLAMRLEGTIRSHGVHAAGVVIAPEAIVNYAPLEMAQKGVVTTQYSGGPVEELGLLKMDFLGLSNLTIIKNALRIISRVHGEEINIGAIPIDDNETLKLLGRGDTTGVFQLESSGMKRYIRELKPDSFEDIVAMVSLYRPGPLTAGLTQKFIDRKNGKEAISYGHEAMKPALESTYGVLVYQEQVMRIAQDLSGLSGGEADTLRKAIGKKKRDVLAKMKKRFIDGAVEKSGADRKFVEDFWKSLEGFADYAFNKSHAACYGLIAYQTAYLKAHYPAPFMAALMTSDFDDIDRLAIEIGECRHMGIEVLAPDVNESFVEFAVVPKKKQIRFGMAAVKNVGQGAVEAILAARQMKDFVSIEDFVSRVSTRVVNRKAWESLIKAGAFDRFGSRDDLLFNLDKILAYGAKKQKDIASGQTDLFGGADAGSNAQLQLQTSPVKTDVKEQLVWERELLGIYLSSHPLDDYRKVLEALAPLSELKASMDSQSVTVGGVVSQSREITTKSGKKMAFVTIEDLSGELEVIVFPNTYADYGDQLVVDAVLVIEGSVNAKDRDGRKTEDVKVMADTIEPMRKKMNVSVKKPRAAGAYKPLLPERSRAKMPAKKTQRLFVHVKNPEDQDSLIALKQRLSASPGEIETVLVVGVDEAKQAIKLPFKVTVDETLTRDLAELFDEKSVILR